MTPHLHSERVPGCYRCELGTDEWLIDITSCDHHVPLDEKCEKCGREVK